MVRATTIEILTNFKAVMDELLVVYAEINKSLYFHPRFKNKNFPPFCLDDRYATIRYKTTRRYMTGKYYSDAPELFKVGYRNKVEEVFNREFKRSFRERLCSEEEMKKPRVSRTYTETEHEYRTFCIKTLYKHIEEKDPQTIQHYKDYVLKCYNNPIFTKTGETFECYYHRHINQHYNNGCEGYNGGCGFVYWITRSVECGEPSKISPYYNKYNVSRNDTKICSDKFYTHLFTGEYNFSLMKIKYAKKGKITNAGLKATSFYYYNGDKTNYEFNSHSKKDDLWTMINMNDIKIPKGVDKYEDLVKILKEKLP